MNWCWLFLNTWIYFKYFLYSNGTPLLWPLNGCFGSMRKINKFSFFHKWIKMCKQHFFYSKRYFCGLKRMYPLCERKDFQKKGGQVFRTVMANCFLLCTLKKFIELLIVTFFPLFIIQKTFLWPLPNFCCLMLLRYFLAPQEHDDLWCLMALSMFPPILSSSWAFSPPHDCPPYTGCKNEKNSVNCV
jgi:hypothetical protein